MADIAFIFHWQPDRMMEMRTGEILDWRDKALTRWQQAHGSSD